VVPTDCTSKPLALEVSPRLAYWPVAFTKNPWRA